MNQLAPSGYDQVAKSIGRRIEMAHHRREVLKERTGMEANQIAMNVAHMVSEAINTNNKSHRRALKTKIIKLVNDL